MIPAKLSKFCVNRLLFLNDTRCCTSQVPAKPPKRIHVESTNKTYDINYAGLVETEWSPKLDEHMMKEGALNKHGVPAYFKFWKTKEQADLHIKAWQIHMQKDNGLLVWEKGPHDKIFNFVAETVGLLLVVGIVYNIYVIITPAKKLNWAWSGLATQKPFQRDSDNH